MNTSHLSMLAISDSGFVFDPRTGHSYAVNSTGLALLRSLKLGQTPTESVQRLQSSFACPVDILGDVLTFVNALTTYELLDSEGAAGSVE